MDNETEKGIKIFQEFYLWGSAEDVSFKELLKCQLLNLKLATFCQIAKTLKDPQYGQDLDVLWAQPGIADLGYNKELQSFLISSQYLIFCHFS